MNKKEFAERKLFRRIRQRRILLGLKNSYKLKKNASAVHSFDYADL